MVAVVGLEVRGLEHLERLLEAAAQMRGILIRQSCVVQPSCTLRDQLILRHEVCVLGPALTPLEPLAHHRHTEAKPVGDDCYHAEDLTGVSTAPGVVRDELQRQADGDD
jgi:hypothetical protein